jgi:hypothetical protein
MFSIWKEIENCEQVVPQSNKVIIWGSHFHGLKFDNTHLGLFSEGWIFYKSTLGKISSQAELWIGVQVFCFFFCGNAYILSRSVAVKPIPLPFPPTMKSGNCRLSNPASRVRGLLVQYCRAALSISVSIRSGSLPIEAPPHSHTS